MKRTILYLAFLSAFGLFGFWACSSHFTFDMGTFTENPDGGFTCNTGDGSQGCSDTDGDGEPDQTDDGGGFVPDPSDGGPGEVLEPPTDPIGDIGEDLDGAGKHFDVDSFWNNGDPDWLTHQVYHVHQYDNLAPHYSVVNFLTDSRFKFVDAAEGCTDLTFHLRHADRESGAMDVTLNGETYTIRAVDRFSDSLGYVEGDFILHVSGPVTNFRLQPNRLDVLVGTQPSVVQKDGTDRHGSFTIQVFCGTQAVWQFATYEHVARGEDRP